MKQEKVKTQTKDRLVYACRKCGNIESFDISKIKQKVQQKLINKVENLCGSQLFDIVEKKAWINLKKKFNLK